MAEVLLLPYWYSAGRASPLLVLPFLFCVPVGSTACWLWAFVFFCLSALGQRFVSQGHRDPAAVPACYFVRPAYKTFGM